LTIPIACAINVTNGVIFDDGSATYLTTTPFNAATLELDGADFYLDGSKYCDSVLNINFLSLRICATYSGGGGSGSLLTITRQPYYDIIVNVKKKSTFDLVTRYYPGDTLLVDIIIKNNGDVPDKDAIMTYYLIDPNGNKFLETREQFQTVSPGFTTLSREMLIPPNSALGNWQVNVDYNTTVQEPIRAHDSFVVGAGYSKVPIFLMIVGALILLFLISRYYSIIFGIITKFAYGLWMALLILLRFLVSLGWIGWLIIILGLMFLGWRLFGH